MPAPSPSPSGAEGSILLVEGYGALATAISAALRKFAPRHRVRVARDLAAARQAVREARPDLLLIDFDPPLRGILDFLAELRSAAPEARVLIIAAGLPRATLADDRLPTALTFVEKPFQLEALGAAVQSLLAPARSSGRTPERNSLDDLRLGDVIPLLGLEGVTEVLQVSAADEALIGQVHFSGGHIRHAVASDLEGIDALREMLRWPAPQFARAISQVESPRSIEGNWPAVLEKVMRSLPRRPLPAADRRPSGTALASERSRPVVAPSAKHASKILVIDDTETLRDFIQEMLTAAQPGWHVITAADGADGVTQCAAFQPDLVVLDYSLPDFNGDEVCRRLLADDTTREIPVIMMSGHVAAMAETEAQYENVVRTLSKPFVADVLVAAVTETLAHPPPRQPRRELALASERKTNGQKPPAAPLAPAHLPAATGDGVVLSLALEVVAMQFSPTLQIVALRARPVSRAVLLHVNPRAAPATRLPEVAFEIARVALDPRGQIQTVFIVPTAHRPDAPAPHRGVPIERLSVVPGDGKGVLQITPAATAHMTIQFMAAFDLAEVELSPSFGVSHFVLQARSEKIRLMLPGQDGRGATTFEATEVRLDASAQIVEIALRAVAA